MKEPSENSVGEILAAVGVSIPAKAANQLSVRSPVNGAIISHWNIDDTGSVDKKISAAATAQVAWAKVPYDTRTEFLKHFSQIAKENSISLATLVTYESGKVPKESEGEAGNISSTIDITIQNAAARNSQQAERTSWNPVGVVGLITSYNFPLAVAGWTIAPAIMAGNSIVWKPSEKTPLTGIALQAVFKKAAESFSKQKISPDLLQVIIGERETGQALVASENVSMISATGSVGMGKSIEATIAAKNNKKFRPILELGGNNAMIISDKNSDKQLDFATSSILTSVFGTGGQRCTNTRRVIIHEKVMDKVKKLFEQKIRTFIESGAITSPLKSKDHTYMYSPLIDKRAFDEFEKAKEAVRTEGGEVIFGNRLQQEGSNAFYVEPALAILPEQTAIMHKETFAPILYLAPYKDKIENALEQMNAPANAGLVNGIFTQDAGEEDKFIKANLAGHGVINSPKGTGTPAHGQGFGGNRDSGKGVILSPDPLAPFTVEGQTMLGGQKIKDEVTSPQPGPGNASIFKVMRPQHTTRVAKFSTGG